jgi:hypothetical protein
VVGVVVAAVAVVVVHKLQVAGEAEVVLLRQADNAVQLRQTPPLQLRSLLFQHPRLETHPMPTLQPLLVGVVEAAALVVALRQPQAEQLRQPVGVAPQQHLLVRP